jgi:hypothetical protein
MDMQDKSKEEVKEEEVKFEERCLSIIINSVLIAYLSEKVEPYYRLTLDIFIVGLN